MAMTLDIAIKNIERTLPSIAFSDSWKCIKTHLSAQAKVRMDDAKAIAGLIQKGYALVPDNLSHIERMLWMGEYVAARLSQGAQGEAVDRPIHPPAIDWVQIKSGVVAYLWHDKVVRAEHATLFQRQDGVPLYTHPVQSETLPDGRCMGDVQCNRYLDCYAKAHGEPTPLEAAQSRIRELEAQLAERAAVPGGMVLVPREPTDWMVSKGTECHTCEQGDSYFRDTDLSDGDCIAIYKAMLSAAPTLAGKEKAG